jgi:hypothetical protein
LYGEFPTESPIFLSCGVNGLGDPIEDLPWGKDVVVSGEDVPRRFHRSRHGATTCFFWVADDADGEKCVFYYHDIPLYMFYVSKTRINQP